MDRGCAFGGGVISPRSRPNLNPFAVLCVLRGEISTQRAQWIPQRSQSINKTRTLPNFLFARPAARASFTGALSGGVMVAQRSLEPLVMVRIHAGQPG